MATENNDTPAFVRISNREIWDALRTLAERVSSMDYRMNEILKDSVEKDKRIRALELRTYTIMAGFTTAAIAAGIAALQGVFGG